MTMIIEENWAVDPRRVREFFTGQPDASKIPEGYSVGGCTVTIAETEGSLLGKWAIQRTCIRFEGEETEVKELHRRFFLRVLSAGG